MQYKRDTGITATRHFKILHCVQNDKEAFFDLPNGYGDNTNKKRDKWGWSEEN
jgi:hypothetical protein